MPQVDAVRIGAGKASHLAMPQVDAVRIGAQQGLASCHAASGCCWDVGSDEVAINTII